MLGRIYKTLCEFAECENIADHKNGPYKLPSFCKDHAPADYHRMDIVECSIVGCKYIAIFTSGGVKFCMNHKQFNMPQLHNKFPCKTVDCTEDAAFGFAGGVAYSCSAHKKEGMIYMRSKCLAPGCDRKAFYNYKNDEKPIYCTEHKLGNMSTKRGK